MKHMSISLKRVVDTRWSANYQSVNAIFKGFSNVLDALDELCDDNENIDTRDDARIISDLITRFSFICF